MGKTGAVVEGDGAGKAELADDSFGGDIAAVYQREYAPLVRLATAVCGDPAVAEEVTQQAFERVWSRWGQVDRPGAYLQRSVLHGAIDECRRRQRRRERDRRLRIATPMASAAPAEPLWDALDQLPDPQRVAVVLRYYADRSIDEIATITDRPPNTVKSDLRRALASLKEALGDA